MSLIPECNGEGYEHLLLDLLIDQWKDEERISLTDQKLVSSTDVNQKFNHGLENVLPVEGWFHIVV